MELNFDICFRALQARDSRFDGLFFIGVRTTGIYCRPVCPARTPRAASCQFFEAAALAEQAGFRPCLRCRPELAPEDPADRHGLAHGLFREIQRQALNGSRLGSLSVRTGFGDRQLRRIIGGAFGITPVSIAQTQRLLFAKKLLQETRMPVSRIAHDAGFRSLRRFNALFLERYGMAPTVLRRESMPGADEDSLRLFLAYRPPLAWSDMLDYLRVRAVAGVEHVTPTAYARTFAFGDRAGWLSVRHIPERHCLELTVDTDFSDRLGSILERLRRLFDLDANPTVIEDHLRRDERLAARVGARPGLRVPGAWDTFELAVRAILGQQISVAGASTLAARLNARFGRSIASSMPELHWLHATPESLVSSCPKEIAAIGIPMARARALHSLACAVVAGALEFPVATPPESIFSSLESLPGIGPWTARYIGMRAYGLPDAMPTADLGLFRATGARTARQLEELSEPWRPWRAYATLHLWHPPIP